MNIKQIVLDLCAMNDEQEWFEFMKKAQPKQWEIYEKNYGTDEGVFQAV